MPLHDQELMNMNELDPMHRPVPVRGSLRKCGILVVDDEASVRGVLNVWMRQQGFVVWLAGGGQEALDLYWRHHMAIDVVLMDVRMAGLDGPRTLAALQQLNPQVRCCFMSGDLGSYTTEQLQNLGAAAVLAKPFDLDEVARVLCEQVGKRDARPIASRRL
jgi:CheY-like chemotaxis protein